MNDKPRINLSLKAVFALLSTLFSGSTAFASGASVWIQNASDRAFYTTTMPTGAPTAINLYAARNEYQGAQILVLSTSAQTGVSVTANALSDGAGHTIPTSNITVTTEITHTGVWEVPGDYQAQPGDTCTGSCGNYTDSLESDTAQSVAANVTQPFYYQVYTTSTQAAGTYQGIATVNSSLGSVNVNVTVIVYGVTIPATTSSTYRMNNWFGSVGWDYTGTPQVIPLLYGVTTYDATWWSVIGNIAKNHAKHRNNVIFADYQGLLAGASTINGSGAITPNWTNFDKFIQTFIDAGAMQYIYTPQQMIADSSGVEQVSILVDDGTGHCTHGQAPAGSTQATNYLNQMFPLLKAHLDTKGWTNLFYMSAEDEPATSSEISSGEWFYGLYGAVFTSPHTNEAHAQMWNMDPYLTTYTPVSYVYAGNVGFYQNERIGGKNLWLYTAIYPQNYMMNRFIAYHLDKTRLLPWQDWKIGATGHLHWGWDYWVTLSGSTYVAQDTEAGGGQGFGDAWLVRPNKPAYDIFDSVRSEAQLYGLQDYELLNILSSTKPLVAKSIAESVMTDMNDHTTSAYTYTRSGSVVETAHKEILDQIVSAQPDPRFPFADNFSSGNNYNWLQDTGTWSVTGGGYNQTTTGLWPAVSEIKGRAYGDCVLTFNVAITNNGGDNTNWAGAVIRSSNGTDMDSGYLIALRDTGQLFLYRSTQTLVASSGATAVPNYMTNHYSPIQIVVQGNNIQVFGGYSATPLINYTDTQNGFTAGNIALITGGSAASFTNVVVNAEQNYTEAKTVSTLSTYTAGGWSPQAAVDGQTSTITGSMGYASTTGVQNREEYVAIDLGKTYPVSRVDLYPRNDGANTGYGFPDTFTIQTSNTSITGPWTTQVTESGYPMPGNAVQSFPFASVNARYIRVDATKLNLESPGGSYRLEFAEVQAVGGNLAAGKTVTASSDFEDPIDGWRLGNATDGTTLSNLGYSMGWTSNVVTSASVTVDLGGSSKFSTVTLFPRNDGVNTGYGFPINFTIQTSPDNTTYTTQVTETGYPLPTNTPQVFSFSTTTARYVKINGTSLRTDSPGGSQRMQFAEIQVQ